jgi:hypothetical protein
LSSVSLFGWLVADCWCWFVLREEYCRLVAGGWFVVREKYCWLVADKPSEQGVYFSFAIRSGIFLGLCLDMHEVTIFQAQVFGPML